MYGTELPTVPATAAAILTPERTLERRGRRGPTLALVLAAMADKGSTVFARDVVESLEKMGMLDKSRESDEKDEKSRSGERGGETVPQSTILPSLSFETLGKVVFGSQVCGHCLADVDIH